MKSKEVHSFRWKKTAQCVVILMKMNSLLEIPAVVSADQYDLELSLQRSFVVLLPELESVARWGHDIDAVTYRLAVGFSACALDAGNTLLPVVGGGNRKRTRHLSKTCAEDVVVSRLAKYGPARLLGGVIFATGDLKTITSVSHLPAHALYNCEDNCVVNFAQNPIVNHHTHLISVIAETGEYESLTFAGVKDKYREPPKSLKDVPKYMSSNNWDDVLTIFDANVLKQTKRPVVKRLAPSEIVQQSLKDKRLRSYHRCASDLSA